MKRYEDDRRGKPIDYAKVDRPGVRYAYSFADVHDVDVQLDCPRDFVSLEDLATPQLIGIRRSFAGADLGIVTTRIVQTLIDDAEEDDYDWSTLEWEGFGWRESEYGRTSLVVAMYLEGEVHGLLIVHPLEVE